jgi:hypothetical protein
MKHVLPLIFLFFFSFMAQAKPDATPAEKNLPRHGFAHPHRAGIQSSDAT